MSTYLINHLRIPGGVPNEEGLSYLEQVEATVAPFGGSGSRRERWTWSKERGRGRSC